MARKQKLIHLHGTSQLNATKAADVEMAQGEIAVMNAAEAGKSELYVLTTGGAVETFITAKAVGDLDSVVLSSAKADATTKANNAETNAKTYADGIKEQLQGQIDTFVSGETSVASQIEAAKTELNQAIASAKTEVDTAAKGYANTAESNAKNYAKDYADDVQSTLQGNIDKKVDQSAYDTKMTALDNKDAALSDSITANTAAINKEVKDRQDAITSVTANYTTAITQSETTLRGEISTAKTGAINTATGYTSTEIERVEKLITAATENTETLETTLRGEISDAKTEAITAATAYTQTEVGNAKTEAITAATAYTQTEVSKVNDALTAHTNNGTVHITAEERTAWNATTTKLNAFFKDADTQDKAVDTLVEIQEFLTGEDGAVSSLLESVSANTTAIANEVKDRQDAITAVTKGYADADAALKTTLQGEISTAKNEAINTATGYTATEIERVEKLITAATESTETLETTLRGEISTAKSEAIATAKTYTDTAKADAIATAQTYANTAESNAKKYAKDYADDVQTTLQGNIDKKVDQTAYNTKMTALEAKDTALENSITANTAAISKEVKDRQDAITAVTKGYTDADAAIVTAYTAADNQIKTDFAAADNQIKTDFAAADTALSNRIKAIEDAKPVYTIEVTNTATNKITATKDNANKYTFNFDNMVIDCGEY